MQRPSRSRALVASEEDLEADDEPEEEEEPVVSYDEFLAAQRKPVALPKLPEARKAGEGVAIKLEQRSAAPDLQSVAASQFKEEVSFTPALTAAGMSWSLVESDDAPEPRTLHAACVVELPEKQQVLMIHGGRNQQASLLGDVWWFDVRTQQWVSKHFSGYAPDPRQAHTLSFLPGNLSTAACVYLVGGNTPKAREDVIHVLRARDGGEWQWGAHHIACSPKVDPYKRMQSSEEWEETLSWCGCPKYNIHEPLVGLLRPHWVPLPVDKSAVYSLYGGISSHSAASMPGQVWIFGGKRDKVLCAETAYIPLPTDVVSHQLWMLPVYEKRQKSEQVVTLKATQATVRVAYLHYNAVPPSSRSAHAAIYVQTKGMYVIGGTNGQQEFNDVWLLSLGTAEWQKIAYTGRLPPLVNTAVALVDTMIYIFGGFSRGVALNNLFVYNTKTNIVTQIDVTGTPPAPRGGHSMAYMDGSLYVFGGNDHSGQYFGDLIRLNSVNDFFVRTSLIGSDLLALLDSGVMCDCQIKSSDGGSIKCHRVVLAARCPYFREQLMKAPTIPEWEFNFPLETLDRFVRFLYRATAQISAAQAPGMKALAALTQMDQLEAICDSIQKPTTVPPSRFAADMQWLLDSAHLSDVELVAGGRVFKAHRTVLSARSKFFRAMFASKFSESQAGAKVAMSDMEPEMMQALLKYVYCESVDPQAHQLAFELLGQCELLELPDLRDRCVDILKAALSVENVSLLHNAAEMCKAPTLAAAALRFALDAALASGGLDEALIEALSDRVFDLVNEERSHCSLPPLQRASNRQQAKNDVLSWSGTCAKCSLPYSYASTAWTGKVPKELLAASAGEAPKYEPVLSLRSQIGHRAKVTLASGVSVAPSLSRNTRRDAEQLAALTALHVTKCGLDASKLV